MTKNQQRKKLLKEIRQNFKDAGAPQLYDPARQLQWVLEEKKKEQNELCAALAELQRLESLCLGYRESRKVFTQQVVDLLNWTLSRLAEIHGDDNTDNIERVLKKYIDDIAYLDMPHPLTSPREGDIELNIDCLKKGYSPPNQ